MAFAQEKVAYTQAPTPVPNFSNLYVKHVSNSILQGYQDIAGDEGTDTNTLLLYLWKHFLVDEEGNRYEGMDTIKAVQDFPAAVVLIRSVTEALGLGN